MREWIVGRNPVYEVLRAGRRESLHLRIAKGVKEKGRLVEILESASERGLRVERVARADLDVLGEGHQGVALQANGYPYSTLVEIFELAEERQEPPFILLLDTLQDPQNLGTLIRTAEAVGVHGILLPLRRTATVTPAVVGASSGASEYMLIAQANLAQGIRTLQENQVWVVGLDSGKEAQPLGRVRLDGALGLVVGNEGQGMRRLVRESCDSLLQLPMRGRVESLNAAVAGSVALYLAWQARDFAEH